MLPAAPPGPSGRTGTADHPVAGTGRWARRGAVSSLRDVPTVLLATDADWIFDEVDAALSSADTTVHRVRAGVEVLAACHEVEPDLVVLDLQIGNMGGMAACLAVRHEEEADRLPPTGILMLLDRSADVFLARRSDADGWLVKPVDAYRLRKATDAVLTGGTWPEGVPDDDVDADVDEPEAEPAGT